MRRTLSHTIILSCATAALLGITGCSDKGTDPPPTRIAGTVREAADTAKVVLQANVVVYDAATNAPVTRAFTGVDGSFLFRVDPGVYYLKIEAQGYVSSPVKDGPPLPFTVPAYETVIRPILLTRESASSNSTGAIWGTVRAAGHPVPGALVALVRSGDSLSFSNASGPDGFYVIYNVTPGTYSVEAYKADYAQSSAVSAVIEAGVADTGIAVLMDAAAGGSLAGRITFLAAPNSIVDITLVHPATGDPVPGLVTRNISGNNFSLSGIAPGTYIVWASYQNDGYVMDPDWIRKFWMPTITFASGDGAKEMNELNVTDAIDIVSPTNPPDSVFARVVTTAVPTFTWLKYEQSKEYIIEVTDENGEVVWGGYTADGVIRHPQIGSQTTSAEFNFDNSATGQLVPGFVYHWKVYADGDAVKDVQGLLSSSEDQLGFFMIVP